MTKIENEKDRELRDYCIRSLAEKKYKEEMDQFYRSCVRGFEVIIYFWVGVLFLY